MFYNIAFRFIRTNYSPTTMQEQNPEIKRRLRSILDQLTINYSHMYNPARNSIKVIFSSDSEINSVMTHIEAFKNEHFEPNLGLRLKASRTVFCTNFDPTITATYGKQDIIESLKQQKWKVKDVYMMKSKKSFKIEFSDSNHAKIFLRNNSTSIGNIILTNNTKEPEVDPTITHCWECGQMEPDHSARNCFNQKICLRCGATDHKFYECNIQKDYRLLTETQKRRRYCAACKKRTDHTTFDHKQCPKKRETIRERARIAREKRLEENENVKRNRELITATLNIANNNEWPEIQTNNKQHTKIITLITLALLDEAADPGKFNKTLEDRLKDNGLPTINYKLGPKTASHFLETVTGTKTNQIISSNTTSEIQKHIIKVSTSSNPNQETQHQNLRRKPTEDPNAAKKASTENKINSAASSRYIRDQTGGKKQSTPAKPYQETQQQNLSIKQPTLDLNATMKEPNKNKLDSAAASKYFIDQTGGKKQFKQKILPYNDTLNQKLNEDNEKRTQELFVKVKTQLDTNLLTIRIDKVRPEGLISTKKKTCNIETTLEIIKTSNIQNNLNWITELKKDLQEIIDLGYKHYEITFNYEIQYNNDNPDNNPPVTPNTSILRTASDQTADYFEMDSFSLETDSHSEDHLSNSDGEDTSSAPAEIFN